ncbi:UDP-N-acetylglucosamine pyrophosphorylase [Elusimicrobium minutum Pei191]|uniref:Bifunctional protein GlmU n=1 Tax=Elusimicrobium minutum (strain Pei191) TaxID=445932 RepID=B2KE97_ELUMP|nr:bifunctional UDP-N-acetylglucosamine diphosphorylase/glucosamine-1-phosphate N-acetyltransferase GlmU [Elusimicrobium minutum]ACC98843.1 UDP-N-acetylglucosamine pyrophosphorylase [Elusimicrobium minutum Pei191]
MVAGTSRKTNKKAVPSHSVKTNKNLCVLVLAGGKGTRMHSSLPKPLHQVANKPMLAHIMQTAQKLGPAAIGVLTGHEAALMQNMVKEQLPYWGINSKVVFTLQRILNGSGTAVKDSFNFLKKYKHVIILSGDAPLIKHETLGDMYKNFIKTKSSCSVLSVNLEDPFGYGRIIRDGKGNFEAIVEETSADEDQKLIDEINSGIYAFDIKALGDALKKMTPQGPKKEYYLTDCIAFIKQKNLKVTAFNTEDNTQALGVNSKSQLAEAENIMRARKVAALLESGVTIYRPESVDIDNAVAIEADAVIYPNNFIYGKTKISAGVIIEPNCFITDSVIEPGAKIKAGSYIESAVVGPKAEVGPYAHLRKNSVLKEKAKVGNFSETKNAVIGEGSKVNHLSYIGDTEMGQKVNVGAGTITCNYDGVNKHKTIIGDNVFLGSNTNLVAPVKLGKNSKTGAGSTITDDIEEGALAIARARQVVLKNRGKIKK